MGHDYDSDQIGPWSRWQGNLDADVLVVARDWGGKNCFVDNKGLEPYGNPTNRGIVKLMRREGIKIGNPNTGCPHVAFFTNAMLCLKEGGLQASVRSDAISKCANHFFVRLVELIQPKVVISMSQVVSNALYSGFSGKKALGKTFDVFVEGGPYDFYAGSKLFPVYTCGYWGKTNRTKEKQCEDWHRIATYLKFLG